MSFLAQKCLGQSQLGKCQLPLLLPRSPFLPKVLHFKNRRKLPPYKAQGHSQILDGQERPQQRSWMGGMQAKGPWAAGTTDQWPQKPELGEEMA